MSLQKISLFLLRISLGWLFLYAGITKLLDPAWSAAGYIGGAQTFVSFYTWLGSASILPFVNMLNMWGLTLIGLSLIIGLWVRWGALAGMLIMLLYYFPILAFPYVGEHSFIVDDHIIYLFGLAVLATFHAGRVWGIDARLGK